MSSSVSIVNPGSFLPEEHWYDKSLNATIHPMVAFFMNLDRKRIISRYCHLNPRVDREFLEEQLLYVCKHFHWSGADLFNATSEDGHRQMVVIENNSCPSGQKSMPLLDEHEEQGSYRLLVERTFLPLLKRRKSHESGRLAVIYDKNFKETSGYASVIADVFDEEIFFVELFDNQENAHLRLNERYLEVHHAGEWHRLRGAFRYLTQRPWNRLPLHSRTKILNPIVACLAGGRNKTVAAKAYDIYNTEIEQHGLRINHPETIWDVSKEEIPLWVLKMGGHAVIKIPYSNAGQGVYTITDQKELDRFMEKDFPYDKYIVQSLIGNSNWSSITNESRFYHVGTIPDKKGQTYVADIRLMVSSTEQGIRPLCIYSRRARDPLALHLQKGVASWQMLGTNLSIKLGENQWYSDTKRLMLMDRRDFNKLGLGLDDLIEAYVQTVLSTIAIDKMCRQLHNSKGKFRMKLFKSLNNDSTLLDEILI